MLDSAFLSNSTALSSALARERTLRRRTGTAACSMLLPDELTVHRGDRAKMSYTTWFGPRIQQRTCRAITLRPRTKRLPAGHAQRRRHATVRLSLTQPLSRLLGAARRPPLRPRAHRRGCDRTIASESREEPQAIPPRPPSSAGTSQTSARHAWRLSTPSAKESPSLIICGHPNPRG